MNTSFFRIFFDLSPLGAAHLEIMHDQQEKTADLRFLEVNPAFEKITGLAAETVSGKTARMLFRENERAASDWRSLCVRIAGGNDVAGFEHYMADTGQWFFVNSWNTDDTHTVITLTDITAGRPPVKPDRSKDVQQHVFWDNNLFAVIIADKNGHYVDANEEACRMTGYSRAELKSMNVLSLIDPERIEVARTHFGQIAKTGKAYAEVAYHTKSGEKRWWNIVATKLSDDRFLGLHEDITGRKRAEQLLRDEEEHHAKVIAGISDVIWEYEVDQQGNFVRSYVSPVADRLLGLPRGSVGQSFEAFLKFTHPDDLHKVQDAMRSGLLSDDNQFNSVDYRIITHEGCIKHLRSSGIVHIDPNGNRQAYGTTSDITELKEKEGEMVRTKQKAEENEALFRAIFEQAAVGVALIASKTGRFLKINKAYCHITGYTEQEMLEIDFQSITHPDDLQADLDKMKLMMDGGILSFSMEKRYIRKDGDIVWVDLMVSPMWKTGEEPKTHVAVVQNITGRKRVQQEYTTLFREMLDGFALHEIILDTAGTPVDYRFLAVNPAFERMTGMKAGDVVGRNVSEILPGTEHHWIETYGRVALTGEPVQFENYHAELGKYFEVTAFRPVPGQFTCVFQDITERKRAEEAHKMSLQLSADIIQAIPSGFLIYRFEDPDRLILLSINPEAERLTGITAAQWAGREFNEIWPEATQLGITGKYLEVMRTGVMFEKEDLFYSDQRLTGAFRIRAFRLPDKKLAVAFENITERKRAEEALKETEERLEFVIEGSQLGYWDWNIQTGKVHRNAQWAEMLGYTLEEIELNVKQWSDLQHPDDQAHAWQSITDHLEGRTPAYRAEYRMRTKGGQYKWILDQARIVARDAEGRPLRMSGTHTDITDRKQAEEALRENVLFTDSLLKAIPVAVFYKDKHGRYVGCNIVFSEMMGVTEEQIRGRTVQELWPGELAEMYHRMDLELMQKKEHQVYEFQVRDKHDKTLSVIFAKDVFLDSEGEVAGLVGAFIDITDRKQAEEELRLNRNMLDTVLNTIPQSVFWKDRESRYLGCNAQFAGAVGLQDPAEIIGKTDYDLPWPKEEAEAYRADDRYVMDHSQPKQHIIEPLQQAGGSRIWIDTTKIPLHDSHGNTYGVLGVYEDITDRKKAEDELRKLFQAVEQSPASVIITGTDGAIEYVNPKFCEITGFTLREAREQNYNVFRTEEMPESTYRELWETINAGNEWKGEFHNKKKTGEFYWEAVSISPIYINTTTITHFLAVKEDITQRKSTELVMERNRAELKAVYDNAPVMIAVIDKNRNLLFANPSFTAFTGVPEAELKGGRACGVFGCINAFEDPQGCGFGAECKDCNLLHAIEDSFLTGSTHKDIEYNTTLVRDKVLRKVSLLGSVAPIHFAGKSLLLLSFVDISDRKRAEEELIRAKEKAVESDRLKSAFLANMSHEIRTPMNGILGFADLLKEPGLSGDEQQRYITIIEKSGQRMLNIINDIIDISKIEAGLMKLNLAESNIVDLLEYIHTFFKPEAEAKGIRLSVSNKLTHREATFITDREKLYAILTNLVKNAIKYSDRGEIELGCSRKEGVVEMYVRDTGIGIPQDRQQAIFERFIQADIDDKMARQGAGLGLAISKAYAEMMGGGIRVESEPGKGSVFFLALPFKTSADEQSETHLQAQADTGDYGLTGLSVIIVDDDEVSVMLLESELKKNVRNIMKVRTGPEAVELVRNTPGTDLVLMDIRLPGMAGYEATRQIRQFNSHVVIIAQTAYGLAGDREKALDAGCNDYIAKPIIKKELQAMLRKHFGKKEK